MKAPLVPVVTAAVRLEQGGAVDVLACGHRVLFDGRFPYARHCPSCLIATTPIPLFELPRG